MECQYGVAFSGPSEPGTSRQTLLPFNKILCRCFFVVPSGEYSYSVTSSRTFVRKRGRKKKAIIREEEKLVDFWEKGMVVVESYNIDKLIKPS